MGGAQSENHIPLTTFTSLIHSPLQRERGEMERETQREKRGGGGGGVRYFPGRRALTIVSDVQCPCFFLPEKDSDPIGGPTSYVCACMCVYVFVKMTN